MASDMEALLFSDSAQDVFRGGMILFGGGGEFSCRAVLFSDSAQDVFRGGMILFGGGDIVWWWR